MAKISILNKVFQGRYVQVDYEVGTSDFTCSADGYFLDSDPNFYYLGTHEGIPTIAILKMQVVRIQAKKPALTPIKGKRKN